MDFKELNRQIQLPNKEAGERCRARWNAIAKPISSLGLLEEAIIQIAELTSSEIPSLQRRAVLVLCADNGVVEEGVTQTGSDITALVAANIAKGHACIRYMSKQAGADVFAVDIGMNEHPPIKGMLDYSVALGTKNMAKEEAMTADEAEQAIRRGMELVRRCKQQGYQILATGEMGIGNTTTSSAVAAVLLGKPVTKVTGRGAGLSDKSLKRKIRVIQAAIRLHTPDSEDPFSVLQKLGGFDLAGLAGIFLGGALYRVPILIDGFISAVAALIAARLCPNALQAAFATHVSSEPAAEMVLKALGLHPIITAGMHLGEGTGAVCALPLLDMALAVYNNMSTFDQIGMEAYEALEQ